MSEAKPNYFTCTLGEAAILRKQGKISAHSFGTVLELIDRQAKCCPESPALGFANPRRVEKLSIQQKPDLVSFAELDQLSRCAATKLNQTLVETESNLFPTTVGLFCHSSLDLVLSWLGLLRLGSTTFFFAPQLEVHAIEHLCSEADVRVILVDKGHKDQLLEIRQDISVIEIPDYYKRLAPESNIPGVRIKRKSTSKTAFLGHTSGTSSGLPKVIFQTEWGAVGCLPVFTDPYPRATFTTTPLYHGGLADALRAWTSGALIWFFPEGVIPVTGNNIRQAVNFARKMSGTTRVKYFSSVPYVLQMLAEIEENAGVKMLESMELVGIGGAPLSPIVGNKLIDSGVKLLSRMGSTECGFLMSSHRDYTKDREWQYLRAVDNSEFLAFESHEEGLSELVVKQRWPLRLMTNREDGSYATADLFEPHLKTPNAWRYHGRGDTLIVLANGKKFDPSPMEDEILSSNKMVQNVLVFGRGRDYAGALLFVDQQDLSDDECLEKIWPDVQRLNRISSRHARIARPNVVILQVGEKEKQLPRSSKGTILRHQAETQYADAIEQAYNSSSEKMQKKHCVSDNELVAFISEQFEVVLGRQINPEQDVYEQGVDSIACAQIAQRIQATLLPPDADILPRNIIYDNGSVLELAMTLKQLRQGESRLPCGREEEAFGHMQRLVDMYAGVRVAQSTGIRKLGKVVVLTGATGALGVHILHQLVDDLRLNTVYCLVRGRSPLAAKKALAAALTKWRLRSEKELEYSKAFNEKVVCLLYDLSASNLGLSDKDRSCLVHEATHIIHSAWTVNFNLELRSFERLLAGTRSLIDVACASGARFYFISSTAAISNSNSRSVPERISSEPRDASSLGYSRSKWVAEQICALAYSQATEANDRTRPSEQPPTISIIRAGQLCGNQSGVWNVKEAYPLLLSTVKLTSCLPDLTGESLNWLPVDKAAKAVIEIALPRGSEQTTASQGHSEVPVYHVVNPHKSPSWHAMLEWVSNEPGTVPFEIVPASAWMKRLEEALAADAEAKYRCQALIGRWKQQYLFDETPAKTRLGTEETPQFEVGVTRQMSPSVRDLQPLERQDVVRMWIWIQENC